MSTRLLWKLVLSGVVASAAPAFADEVRDHRDSAQPTARVYRRRPGPRFMLPLRVDLGATGSNTSRGFAPGVAGSIGVHWASLSPTPTDTDVGIGLFGALLGAPTDPTMTSTNDTIAYGGAYLEAGHVLSHGDFWRTWVSGRGEYLKSTAFGTDHKGFGGAVRISAELFASGVGIEPRGLFLGSYSVGFYAEAGVHDVAPGLGAFQVTGGLTFGSPLVVSP